MIAGKDFEVLFEFRVFTGGKTRESDIFGRRELGKFPEGNSRVLSVVVVL